MKHLILLAFIVCLFSCKKDETQTPTRSPIVTTPPVTSTGDSIAIYFKAWMWTYYTTGTLGDFKYSLSNARLYIKRPLVSHDTVIRIDTALEYKTYENANLDLTAISNVYPINNTINPHPIWMKINDTLVFELDTLEWEQTGQDYTKPHFYVFDTLNVGTTSALNYNDYTNSIIPSQTTSNSIYYGQGNNPSWGMGYTYVYSAIKTRGIFVRTH